MRSRIRRANGAGSTPSAVVPSLIQVGSSPAVRRCETIWEPRRSSSSTSKTRVTGLPTAAGRRTEARRTTAARRTRIGIGDLRLPVDPEPVPLADVRPGVLLLVAESRDSPGQTVLDVLVGSRAVDLGEPRALHSVGVRLDDEDSLRAREARDRSELLRVG